MPLGGLGVIGALARSGQGTVQPRYALRATESRRVLVQREVPERREQRDESGTDAVDTVRSLSFSFCNT